MNTIYDWVTMGIFGCLVVLFLHRSSAPEDQQDSIYLYLPAALGCALANYLGNHGWGSIALALICGVVGYIIFLLHPFQQRREP